MSEPTTISRDAYLKAFGLFTIMNDHFCKGQECEDLMNKLLGLNSGNHVTDLSFDKNVTPHDFDEALAKSKITVEDAPIPTGDRA